MTDYDAAIRLNPKLPYAFNNRGNTWNNKGQYDKAIADYSEAIRLDPSSGHPYASRGRSWYLKRVYHRSIADYNKPVSLDPEDKWTHNARACSGPHARMESFVMATKPWSRPRGRAN